MSAVPSAFPGPTVQDLTGKVALVVGASSGIGAATARCLARHGMAVAVAARDEERLQRVADDMASAGGMAVVVPTDVRRREDCDAAVARTVRELGRLDVLVNSAGVMLMSAVENADPNEWAHMMDVNVLGSMYLARAALPYLLERRGSLVQLSSAAGRVARPNTAAYCASKWAITAFCDALRQEVAGRGTRVIVLEPGSTDTDLRLSITDPAVLAAVTQRAATVDPLRPEDVAEVIAFALAQPARVSMNEVLFRPTLQSW